MGDILHAAPAVAALRRARPDAELAWVMEPRWIPLLAGSGLVDHLLPFNRRDLFSIGIAWRWLKRFDAEIAIDFQGLIKSALVARTSGAPQRFGLPTHLLRERSAGVFYTDVPALASGHVVEQNAGLIRPLAPGAQLEPEVTLAPGCHEGQLPEGDFVLASPYAGWKSKQWPIENYTGIAQRLAARGIPLVLNVAPGQSLPPGDGLWRHESSIAGLIGATRRARLVLGLDSGPMHLAAVLGKPGVALFGPTLPERNGPYSPHVTTLRVPEAVTSYKRENEISSSMRALTIDRVWQAIEEKLG